MKLVCHLTPLYACKLVDNFFMCWLAGKHEQLCTDGSHRRRQSQRTYENGDPCQNCDANFLLLTPEHISNMLTKIQDGYPKPGQNAPTRESFNLMVKFMLYFSSYHTNSPNIDAKIKENITKSGSAKNIAYWNWTPEQKHLLERWPDIQKQLAVPANFKLTVPNSLKNDIAKRIDTAMSMVQRLLQSNDSTRSSVVADQKHARIYHRPMPEKQRTPRCSRDPAEVQPRFSRDESRDAADHARSREAPPRPAPL